MHLHNVYVLVATACIFKHDMTVGKVKLYSTFLTFAITYASCKQTLLKIHNLTLIPSP